MMHNEENPLDVNWDDLAKQADASPRAICAAWDHLVEDLDMMMICGMTKEGVLIFNGSKAMPNDVIGLLQAVQFRIQHSLLEQMRGHGG